NGAFAINATTGAVTVADASKIDFESATNHAYTITVQASDGTLTSTDRKSVVEGNGAPIAPVDSDTTTANSVAEGAQNGTYTGLTAFSPDVSGGTVNSCPPTISNGAFAINATTGAVTVADASKIDFESATNHAYTITVQASDGTLTS